MRPVKIEAILTARQMTAAEWTALNPILKSGEFGYEKDAKRLKIGDGVARWNDVPYFIDQNGAILPLIEDLNAHIADNEAHSAYLASITTGVVTAWVPEDTKWGVDGDGDPYRDPTGQVVEDERALVALDADTGVTRVVIPQGSDGQTGVEIERDRALAAEQALTDAVASNQAAIVSNDDDITSLSASTQNNADAIASNDDDIAALDLVTQAHGASIATNATAISDETDRATSIEAGLQSGIDAQGLVVDTLTLRRDDPSIMEPTTALPSGWESYTPLDLTGGGEVFLDNSTDYLIRDQAIVGSSFCRLRGGRNIVLLGVERAGDPNYTGVGEDTVAFEFRDEPATAPGRTIHIEGVNVHAPNLSQGFILNCSTADVKIVNCRMYADGDPARFANCDQRDGTNGLSMNHPDLIQSWSGYGGRIYGFNSLTIDGLTAKTGYQGLFFQQEANSSIGDITMRRMDLHQGQFTGAELDAAPGIVYTGGALLWFQEPSAQYTLGEHCYFEVLPDSLIQNGNYYRSRYWNGSAYVLQPSPGGGDLADAFQPPGSATLDGDTATFAAANINGVAHAWSASIGELVSATLVGVGYSPTSVRNEAVDRSLADSVLQTAIDAEETRATSAESGLQTQITATAALRGLPTFVQSTTPAGTHGQSWLDDDGALWIFFDDGDSQTWVQYG